ncbi:IMPACT family protein [Pedobacter cryophilus]|uniref:YigZ family protein n=1 Tax=Pedobacter cryophilus TaxID=2571271 RepID=A0A4U1BYK1_9SPHI|nr:YigZ family protein [Pedobacter cryophilus]TKB97558.1 YigZ family protein [Pedobacter cryophilus]
MLFDDTYKTILAPSEGVFKDKGSKFLAYAFPFTKEDQLKEIIIRLKAEHAKARHWCYAYRLTPDRSVFRVNDDGEPSGTAGRPILNTLLSKEITNVLVVVVRYFGGTLLGVPGLINAYKLATEDAINQAQIIEKKVKDIYEVSFEYLQMNEVMKLIKDEHLESFEQEFDLTCNIKIAVNQSDVNRIIDKLGQLQNIKTNFLQTV